MGDNYDIDDHNNIYLPSNFIGSHWWCSTQTADALCLARWAGQPTFFITMTSNPKWPEVSDFLPRSWHLTASNVPTLIIHIFNLRLSLLFKDLQTTFGRQ